MRRINAIKRLQHKSSSGRPVKRFVLEQPDGGRLVVWVPDLHLLLLYTSICFWRWVV